MRFPWQPKPGMVRISHRELIELQRGALRAYELEIKNRDLRIQTASLEAQLHLAVLAAAEVPAVRAITEAPPLTDDGQLHEPALAALVDAVVWAHRESELARLGSTSD